MLVAWVVILVPGGIGDLIFTPHRVATVIGLAVVAAIVFTTAWRWPRVLAIVRLVLAALRMTATSGAVSRQGP